MANNEPTAVIIHSYTHTHKQLQLTHKYCYIAIQLNFLLSDKQTKSMLGQFALSHLQCMSPKFSSSSSNTCMAVFHLLPKFQLTNNTYSNSPTQSIS